jgi:hypothetical protein
MQLKGVKWSLFNAPPKSADGMHEWVFAPGLTGKATVPMTTPTFAICPADAEW